MITRIPIKTVSNTVIFAEVEEVDVSSNFQTGPVKAGLKEKAKKIAEDATVIANTTFEALIDLYLSTNANAFCSSLTKLKHPPESAEITFGLKLTGEFGATLCKASGDATYNIKLKWGNINEKEESMQ